MIDVIAKELNILDSFKSDDREPGIQTSLIPNARVKTISITYIRIRYLHCVVCSTIRRHCILALRFGCASKALSSSFYSSHNSYPLVLLHFVNSVEKIYSLIITNIEIPTSGMST